MAYIMFLLLLLQNEICEPFRMYKDTDIKNNQLLAVLANLPESYELLFEFKAIQFLNKWASLIHLTIDGDNSKYGDRTPGVWVSPSNKLYFASAINGTVNSGFYANIIYPLNEWIQVKVSQSKSSSKYVYAVEVANNVIYNTQNDLAMNFKNVKVFLANPWYLAQPGFIRNLSILNTCAESFTLANESEIKDNQLLTVFTDFSAEYELSFDFKPITYLSKWASIIHFTIENDCCNYGDRTPGVWISPYNILHVQSAISGVGTTQFNLNQILPLNEWIKIKISQINVTKKYIFSIEVANKTVYSIQNTLSKSFSNVKVYLGDPWNSAQPGFIRSLIIVNMIEVTEMFCKPLIGVNISGQVSNINFLTINTTLSYAYETGAIAYNLTWEYMLPYFSKISSQSKTHLEVGSTYTIPGAFVTDSINQYMNIILDMRSCSMYSDFTLEIPLNISFNDNAGYLINQFTSLKTTVTITHKLNRINIKDYDALKESYSRGICWDSVESFIYACVNLYVTTQKTACYVSNNYGKKWSKLDIRVGSVLGHHMSTRDLYVIHRNQKTYLMYHKTYKKWLAISNNEFERNIYKNLNFSACLKLEGNYEQILTFQTQQWMGNDVGLFFRKSPNDTWTQQIEWKKIQ
ncbi:uncharacterized protein LOC105848976 isoform X2 [Hydra vulgaris]|uniref:uncharacterized protein LOC105848976 isoform X2 n=1 Tax=Hydra vulgaris TaxID=6087 RepID=UPI001F5E62A0|nr:uncharacterized protein LOC105848976 isoform X2 [Hydra vulgaris]